MSTPTIAGSLAPLPADLTGLPLRYDAEPNATWGEYRQVINNAISNDPRTLQKRIGPSGIGNPCDHCLAATLAGVEQIRDEAWLPTIGKAVHAWLEEVFTAENTHIGDVRYLVEMRVDVGEINGEPITGHADLFDVVTGDLTDWKIVGATSLRAAKGKVKPEYRIQQHLYGRGLTRRGLTVRNVRLAHLPRNAVSLDQAVIWSEPYDEQVALDALARAETFARNIALLRTVNGDIGAYLATLARIDGCWDCSRYPNPDGSTPPAPGRPKRDALDELLGK